MTLSARPLMVEFHPTPEEFAHGRCTDCRAPLGPTYARAWRGIAGDGSFTVQAICLRCADREKWIVATGTDLPRPPVYRRRLARWLMATGAAALALAFVLVFIAPVASAALAPLGLLAIPGRYLYQQGITSTKRFAVEK